jgi:prokaryotic YEATS domain/TIR domain
VTLEIAQWSRFVHANRWEWAVWVEGEEAQLDKIEAVEYPLHPTFPQPVQRVRDRRTKFRLDEWCSEEFEINAHVLKKDGTKTHLKHWLELPTPDGERAPAKETKKVFVSYAAADAEWANAIRSELAARGFQTMVIDDMLDIGKPWQASIAEAIDEADLVVGVFSDATSPSVLREVAQAQKMNVEVVPIAVGSDANMPKSLESNKMVSINEKADLPTAIDSFVSAHE